GRRARLRDQAVGEAGGVAFHHDLAGAEAHDFQVGAAGRVGLQPPVDRLGREGGAEVGEGGGVCQAVVGDVVPMAGGHGLAARGHVAVVAQGGEVAAVFLDGVQHAAFQVFDIHVGLLQQGVITHGQHRAEADVAVDPRVHTPHHAVDQVR